MKNSKIILWVTTIIVLYHIIVAGNLLTWLGIFVPSQSHRAITLAAGLTLIFLFMRSKKQNQDKIPWYDYILLASSLLSLGYVAFFYEKMLRYAMYGSLDTIGVVLALMLAIPLLEAARRKTGLVFPLIIVVLVLITIFQKYLPGILNGQGYPLDRLLYSSYVGTHGIFGLPLGVASTVLIIFLVFGALMERAGAGKWFMDLALALTGWSRGGPAKAAVLSSALFGSISGSPSSNVATTGAFTIPLMKSTGYSAKFAGAVEAVASTGGQILPPVMGAIAFVMAEWLQIPYAEIALAALVPALLYFLIAFIAVHLQALKTGIKPLPLSQLPKIMKVLKEGWFYTVPLLVLIYFLIIKGLPPAIAGIYSFPSMIVVSFFSKNKDFWLTPKKMMLAFKDATFRWVTVVAITASVGILIGALELSGLGIKISRFVLAISGEDLILTLLLVGICSLILGMGLDAIPAYITLATLMAPALINLGVPELTSHLFVVYWGLASFITPPVCIAVYVAIGISGSNVWETGWEAMKVGIAAFLIPFAFVFNPGLLLVGETTDIVISIITAVIGSMLVAMGVLGYSFAPMNVVQRIVVLIAGWFLILPGIKLMLTGLFLAAIIAAWQFFSEKKQAVQPELSTKS
ncbi:TRAP transporter permease [Bacillus sp. Marseille-P3661]|uniref:TRAP transporter permease n=1 Tax=Bacillus sp. Marseille-P3661 TaxID=1936234 RepID=UPI000C821CAA|nr:TRAP transporter fused permease subunit [Bacillus sp. Marseille-P3661]